MVERKKGREVIILATVPSCPYCAGGIRKKFYNKEVYYTCHHCQATFKIKEIGHYEHELICEEVEEYK